jgi:hypothetical protein
MESIRFLSDRQFFCFDEKIFFYHIEKSKLLMIQTEMMPVMYRICVLHHGYHFDEAEKKKMKREQQRNIDTTVYHTVPVTCLDEQSSLTNPNNGFFLTKNKCESSRFFFFLNTSSTTHI